MDGYGWWLIVLGMAIALALVWLFGARLSRDESDVAYPERLAEAAWISRTIERNGGIAPVPLVEEVLELHQVYLADPRLAQPPIELPEAPLNVEGRDPSFGPPGGSPARPQSPPFSGPPQPPRHGPPAR
ncbi:hypothetical protein BH23CHL8_BH23CHL8_06570 [soil metagenome]